MKHATLGKLCGVFLAILAPLAAAQDTPPAENEEIPYSRNGADTCLRCHDEDQRVLALFRTRHAVPGDNPGPFGDGQLQCEACHGPGGNHAGRVRRGQERPPVITFRADDPTPEDIRSGMCLGCHETQVGTFWHGAAHASNGVTCTGCHSVHSPNDAVLTASTQNDRCFDCHIRQRTESRKPYAHPLNQGKMSCSSCHSPHGSTGEHDLVRNIGNDTCYQCHAERRGPFLWEHAPVAEDCTICHAPHGANQPGMLTRRAPLLCQSCHAQSGHPSIAHGSDGLASGAPSQYLLGNSCLNCHTQVHGSNHPSGSKLMR